MATLETLGKNLTANFQWNPRQEKGVERAQTARQALGPRGGLTQEGMLLTLLRRYVCCVERPESHDKRNPENSPGSLSPLEMEPWALY